MTIIKRILLIVLAAALVLSLSACGGEKTVEIRNVQLNEDKSMLSIEYVAKGDIPAGEGAFRISVSGDIGEVYGMSNVKDDLKSGHQHVLLFAMRPAPRAQMRGSGASSML